MRNIIIKAGRLTLTFFVKLLKLRGAHLDNYIFAFLMTLGAGLSTGIGSLLALFAKNSKNTRFLSLALGFSAGVMIYVSMIEIFQKAKNTLCTAMGDKEGLFVTMSAFFGGMLMLALIDRFIPCKDAPDEIACLKKVVKGNLFRTGIFTAIAIGIHNLPEGLATFLTALKEPTLATPVVVAIAIHNIPEGISVSIPIYYATKSKRKAFFYSFLSGVTEPLGALIGYMILLPIMSDTVFGIMFALVSGIMVYISIDALLPTAHQYGEHSLSVKGAVMGMAVMALSLWLFV